MNSITPIYCGKAIQYFFSHACINIYQGQTSIDLMKFLPLLKEGYAIKHMLSYGMHAYLYTNHLVDIDKYQFIRLDELFIKAFDSDIMATSYTYIDNDGDLKGPIEMQLAIDTGLISRPMTTFQIIKAIYPHVFDEEYLKKIYALNYLDKRQWPMLKIYLQDNNFINQLFIEYALGIDIFILLKFITQSGRIIYTVKDIILEAIESNRQTLLDHMLTDKWLKLLYAIITSNIEMMISSLIEVDPRNNDNGAYHLAVECNNSKIIEIISFWIIRRNWYEREAISCGFNLLCGGDNPSKEIYKYLRLGF